MSQFFFSPIEKNKYSCLSPILATCIRPCFLKIKRLWHHKFIAMRSNSSGPNSLNWLKVARCSLSYHLPWQWKYFSFVFSKFCLPLYPEPKPWPALPHMHMMAELLLTGTTVQIENWRPGKSISLSQIQKKHNMFRERFILNFQKMWTRMGENLM